MLAGIKHTQDMKCPVSNSHSTPFSELVCNLLSPQSLCHPPPTTLLLLALILWPPHPPSLSCKLVVTALKNSLKKVASAITQPLVKKQKTTKTIIAKGLCISKSSEDGEDSESNEAELGMFFLVFFYSTLINHDLPPRVTHGWMALPDLWLFQGQGHCRMWQQGEEVSLLPLCCHEVQTEWRCEALPGL